MLVQSCKLQSKLDTIQDLPLCVFQKTISLNADYFKVYIR